MNLLLQADYYDDINLAGGTAAGDHLDALVAAKATTRIAVCIPARNEAATIADVVRPVEVLRDAGLVDELVVVDDLSSDATAATALAVGANVVCSATGPGKGQALTTAVAATDADVLIFLDADVTNFSGRFVTQLAAPLLRQPAIQLVKAAYRRPWHGLPDQGGRVTELLARPLLRRFFPELSELAQPLAGECAVRRGAVEGVDLASGYGVEIGLLIDIWRRFGPEAIAEADLGERIHRNRPLRQLRPHTDDIVAAVLERAPFATNTRGGQP